MVLFCRLLFHLRRRNVPTGSLRGTDHTRHDEKLQATWLSPSPKTYLYTPHIATPSTTATFTPRQRHPSQTKPPATTNKTVHIQETSQIFQHINLNTTRYNPRINTNTIIPTSKHPASIMQPHNTKHLPTP